MTGRECGDKERLAVGSGTGSWLMKLWQTITIVICSALITGIIWTVWSLFAPVPTVTKIVWSDEVVWLLPFSISRWWDVLFAPIYASLIALLFFFDKPQALLAKYLHIKKDEMLFTFGLGLIIGLVVGLAAYLILGLNNWVGPHLIFCIVINAVFGVIFGLGFGLGSGPVFGLGVGLAAISIFALGLGALVGFFWLGKKIIRLFLASMQ